MFEDIALGLTGVTFSVATSYTVLAMLWYHGAAFFIAEELNTDHAEEQYLQRLVGVHLVVNFLFLGSVVLMALQLPEALHQSPLICNFVGLIAVLASYRSTRIDKRMRSIVTKSRQEKYYSLTPDDDFL